MNRRFALAWLACWPTRGLLAQEMPAGPRQKISAARLYEALSARFPLRLAIAPVLQVQISAPRLLLLPARNQLGAALRAEFAGLQLGGAQAGEMDLVFGLRYEPSDRSLRARDPQILEIRWPGLPPETAQALQGLLPALSQQLGEVVLHRFTARDLALPETMGLQPQELQVVDDGLLVLFGPKPRGE
ncbi:MAG TPA: DUF1439 domain-containing protein [Ramlibacter sp.]|uniref:DUF1439 domain-containing protein n=1 Tax=Ramlibacter sp. TaxID=1917967 RepID=UPI002D7F8422|nr:DUF1439 domain-containing protein [Ramlibacter sp.]HET8745946.1 DUF1439 domain-containing protein [Ramlibacter sp.]